MMFKLLLVTHIAVLGYWLGAELVINATYRYVAFSDAMPFRERDRLMEHVMHMDQHVRYALVLQAILGTVLAISFGWIPGGASAAVAIGMLGAVWLTFVEIVHRLRHLPLGRRLAAFDRGSRYVLIIVLLAIGLGFLASDWALPDWLRWKLAAFAGVVACGVGIRFALISHFRTWQTMRSEGANEQRNRIIRRTYVQATSVLILLWVFIAAVVVLSVLKPM